MPQSIILTNAGFFVGTGSASADRDISNRTRSISWTDEADEHDVTVMGSTTRIRAIGLSESNIDLEVMQSYTTTDGGENIDALLATLEDLSATGKPFLVRMRRTNAGKSATNPEYSMLAVMSKRTIVDGEVGGVLMSPITFLSAGDVTRSAVSS